MRTPAGRGAEPTAQQPIESFVDNAVGSPPIDLGQRLSATQRKLVASLAHPSTDERRDGLRHPVVGARVPDAARDMSL
jgi:hypothetical protein